MRSYLPIVIFFAGLGTSVSISCYECTGDCDRNLEEIQQIACEKQVDYCLKIVLDGELTRSCAYDEPRTVDCQSFGDTTKCYCQSDLCNSGNKWHPSKLTGVSLALATLLVPLLLGQHN